MSLFSWLSPHKKQAVVPSTPASSGLSRMDSTKPFTAKPAAAQGHGQPANRKSERMARRELLYVVVREAMGNAGVLSSSYKFKVLSLDPRGRQFLVMIDLAAGAGGETHRLAEIEAMIAQHAKARFDILVSAVYWRSNEHVAVGDPVARPASVSRPAPLAAEPAPAVRAAQPEPSQPAMLHPAATGSHGRYEALHPEEVEAFRRAFAAGNTGQAATATAARHPAQNYTLLTGFEDTELPDAEIAAAAAALSATQYGELR